MKTMYGIKDLRTNEYWCGSGAGYRAMCAGYWNTCMDDITLYRNKGPVTTFINQFNNRIEQDTKRRNDWYPVVPPTHRDLVLVEIEINYREI